MPTTRTTILVLVSIFVSAMVAGTALAQPTPDPSASSSSSASPPSTPPPALPDWAVCMSKCEASGKLVCGSPADIQKACSDIPECVALPADQAKAVNGFCDQCRESQKNCDTPATPPAVTTTNPTTTNPTPVNTAPVTPQQECLRKGGVLIDGVCMTTIRAYKELTQLRADVDALKAKQDATDKEIADIKARLDAVEKAQGLPQNFKDYIKSVIDPNMEWVKKKFEQVEYKLDTMDVSNAALSQRVDNDEKIIGSINNRVIKVEKNHGGGIVGFQAGGFGLAHPQSLNGETVAEVGGKGRLILKVVNHFRVALGIGGAYGTEIDNDSSAVLHIEGGPMIDVVSALHIELGFIMDNAFVEGGKTDWSFKGGYFQPEVCIPNDITACLQLTAALGGMSAYRTEDRDVTTKIDGELGGSIVISYLPY